MYRKALPVLSLCLHAALPVNAGAAVPLVAEFESSHLPTEPENGDLGNGAVAKTFAWTLARTDTEVVVQDSLRGTEERWQRDEAGRIRYSRVFHAQKHVLEFSPADFKRMGSSKWEQIASVIDPAALESLHVAPKQEVLGRVATVYRGKVNEQEIEIGWLEQEQLPAWMSKRDPSGTQTMRLVTLSTMKDGPDGSADLSEYDISNLADIGDRPHDPLLEELMNHEGVWMGR